MRTLLLSLAISGLLANVSLAGDAPQTPAGCTEVETCGSPGCCAHCGCHCGCEKHWKIVCEMKEVKKTVWSVKCEEFCPLMPNCGHCCGSDCCNSDSVCSTEAGCSGNCNGKKCDPCAAEKDKHYVTPKCGKVREKKTLEKKEVVCKVPSYKCVVEYACANCGAKQCDGEKAPAAAPTEAPAPPAPTPSKTTLQAPLPPVVGASFLN